MTPSFLFSFATLGLLVGLVVLVLAKRLTRAAAERRSSRRRHSWEAALGSGPVRELRMKEIRALARDAARSRRAQEDLLALISAGRLPPADDRRQPFAAALRRTGLQHSLRRACESRDAVKRGRAALIWAGLGLPGGERVIVRLTEDSDPDVRAAAVQALAACASEDAAWALIQAMRGGSVPPERCAERLTGPWAVAPLLSALNDPGFSAVRSWLAESLGLTSDPRAVGPLIRLLSDGDDSQRIRACRALGRLGDGSASGVLVEALADPSAAVRAQAARALAELRDERSVYALVQLLGDTSWWVRARAGEALRALGAPGIAALRWCAETHTDPYARERAVEALAHALAEAEDVQGPVETAPAVVA